MTTKRMPETNETAGNLIETNTELDSKTTLNEKLAADDIRPIVNKEIKSRGAGRKDREYNIAKIKADMKAQGVKVQLVPGHGRIKLD